MAITVPDSGIPASVGQPEEFFRAEKGCVMQYQGSEAVHLGGGLWAVTIGAAVYEHHFSTLLWAACLSFRTVVDLAGSLAEERRTEIAEIHGVTVR